jgi:hypothetical protein
VGFEPTIPASARPQTYASDRAATGIGLDFLILPKKGDQIGEHFLVDTKTSKYNAWNENIKFDNA